MRRTVLHVKLLFANSKQAAAGKIVSPFKNEFERLSDKSVGIFHCKTNKT